MPEVGGCAQMESWWWFEVWGPQSVRPRHTPHPSHLSPAPCRTQAPPRPPPKASGPAAAPAGPVQRRTRRQQPCPRRPAPCPTAAAGSGLAAAVAAPALAAVPAPEPPHGCRPWPGPQTRPKGPLPPGAPALHRCRHAAPRLRLPLMTQVQVLVQGWVQPEALPRPPTQAWCRCCC